MKKILIGFIIVLFSFITIGCGQTGRLYLPDQKQVDHDITNN